MQKTLDKQIEAIKRGTVEIISEKELREKLEISIKKSRPLIVKSGFDPTVADIHLGHTVLLRKLRQFQDLGHKVVFLIGDATALIGDPSGQSQTRKTLTLQEVEKNASTYVKQVGSILNTEDDSLFELRYNSKWFSPFTFTQFVELAQRYTVARLLERDDFQKRLKENKPITYLELFYPLMQGYDSYKLKADIEVGGTDQKFNLLVGRDIQQAFGMSPQVVITMPLLEGLDGVQKMSKSYGNYIGIKEAADEMFGKVMSVSDELMHKFYELLTDENLVKVKAMHPKSAKLHLAESIVTDYHGKAAADRAREAFERVFSRKELPQEVPVYQIKDKSGIVDILVDSGLAKTKNEVRRLIREGAVAFNDVRLDKEDFIIEDVGILKVGKRRFLRIQK